MDVWGYIRLKGTCLFLSNRTLKFVTELTLLYISWQFFSSPLLSKKLYGFEPDLFTLADYLFYLSQGSRDGKNSWSQRWCISSSGRVVIIGRTFWSLLNVFPRLVCCYQEIFWVSLHQVKIKHNCLASQSVPVNKIIWLADDWPDDCTYDSHMITHAAYDTHMNVWPVILFLQLFISWNI
jgi:hypothetical protein